MKKMFLMAVVALTVLAGCSSDDDDFVVNRMSVYGDWRVKEVNVDGAWIDAKKANQTYSIMLTEDGYWMTASEPYPYEVKEKSVECYNEKRTEIKTIIRFTSMNGNMATAKVSWPATGKSIEARMVRDTSPYYCKAPSSYLKGVWDIVNTDNGGTVVFDYYYAEIKDGDFSLKGSFGRHPIAAWQTIIYETNGGYWEKRSPYFFVDVLDEDTHIDSIAVRGSYDYRLYGDMCFTCVKR